MTPKSAIKKATGLEIIPPAAVGVNGDLAGGDLVFVSPRNELLGQFGAFTGIDHRAGGIAADDVQEVGTNGDIHLMVKAGHAMHPTELRLVPFGLPFGSKCRLV